jgi:hypothetical protein
MESLTRRVDPCYQVNYKALLFSYVRHITLPLITYYKEYVQSRRTR